MRHFGSNFHVMTKHFTQFITNPEVFSALEARRLGDKHMKHLSTIDPQATLLSVFVYRQMQVTKRYLQVSKIS
jgi:ABC-type phosphate transport system auxiliary subunit